MEEKKITFRYDTLCITEGRYEFKRIYKRPWRVMLCGIFNMTRQQDTYNEHFHITTKSAFRFHT